MYDRMKMEFITKMRHAGLEKDIIATVTRCLDSVMADRYEVTGAETALVPADEYGQNFLLELYLNSQAQFWLNDGTEENYRYQLLGRYGFFTLCHKTPAEVKPLDIVAYFVRADEQRKLDRQDIPSNRTKNRYLQCLNTFYTWAIEKKLLSDNPVKSVQKFPEDINQRDYADRDELEILRNACVDNMERALVEVMLITGARRAEVAAMTIGDIDWDNRTIDIKCGKGHKERYVAFNSRANMAIRNYLRTEKPYKGKSISELDKSLPLFGTVSGAPIAPASLAARFTKIVKRAEIDEKHITCHSMRHSCITLLLEEGTPIEQVRQYAGHADIKTTTIYDNTDKQKILSKVSKIAI